MTGAIFDFDGTIADSCYVWEAVDVSFFAARGMEIPKGYVKAISTMTMYEGAVFTKRKYGIKESVEEIMEEWREGALKEYGDRVILKPFAGEYIHRLKSQGVRIGLATSSSPEFYTPVLERAGIYSLFDAFVDGSMGLPGKSVPDIFLECSRRLKVTPGECTVYEDVLPAILSAASAGMHTVAVYEAKSHKSWDKIRSAADSSIMSFRELM